MTDSEFIFEEEPSPPDSRDWSAESVYPRTTIPRSLVCLNF